MGWWPFKKTQYGHGIPEPPNLSPDWELEERRQRRKDAERRMREEAERQRRKERQRREDAERRRQQDEEKQQRREEAWPEPWEQVCSLYCLSILCMYTSSATHGYPIVPALQAAVPAQRPRMPRKRALIVACSYK